MHVSLSKNNISKANTHIHKHDNYTNTNNVSTNTMTVISSDNKAKINNDEHLSMHIKVNLDIIHLLRDLPKRR